jgi:hypothetical protein
MKHPKSFRDIVEWWPTARTLGDELGVTIHVVQQWKRIGIPAPYWQSLLETKTARRNRLTATALVRLADHRR